MKMTAPMLVITDMEKTKNFYQTVLKQAIVMDLGANVTFSGGFAVQTKESWAEFISKDPSELLPPNNSAELYFEDPDFDAFAEHISKIEGIDYVHPLREAPWGQRVLRFYDPDKHMIEVAEPMEAVCHRMLGSGMTPEQVAQRTMMPLEFIKHCQKQ